MPAVIAGAALSALATAATAGFAAAAIGTIATSFATSLVLGGLSYALTPKPKKPSFVAPTIPENTTAVNQSDLSRKHVYGHTRVTTGYAHMWSTGANGKMHAMLMLCEGPVRAINEVWVNDYCIPNDWIDEEGNVTEGRYAGKLVLRKHLGTETQGADSLAVANLEEWTEDHRLAGIAYIYIIATKDQDVYPTGWPNFSAIVEGPSRYDPRTEENTWSTNLSIHSRDFITNDTYGFGAFSDDIDDTNIAAQANICDEIVETNPESFEVSDVDDGTDIITLDRDILTLCFGDRVTVSSTGTVPGGLSDEDVYYVIPYQVKDSARIKLAETLDDAMAKTAINITSAGTGDITITKTGEPRYHGSGVVETESALSETLNDLVTCMAGRAVNTGGAWRLIAGAWRTPASTYDIGDLRSAMSVKRGLPMSEAFNVTKGLFRGPASFYQPTDYPSARYQEFIDDDGGLETPKDLNLPFIDRPTCAQRVAKIELFRSRQDIVFTSDFSAKALQNQPGDNIELDIDRLGWEEKEFEITEFSTRISDTILCGMTLRETAQEIFDWSAGEAIGFDPSPNTTLTDAYDVVAVQGVSYSSTFIDTTGSEQVGILSLSWSQHPDQFVTQFGAFEIQYKTTYKSDGTTPNEDWLPSFFVAGILTQSDIVTSSVNIPYDIRIRARNNLGVRSSWTTILGAVVGSSGGVTSTDDWGSVADAPSTSDDWGSVADAPSTTDDWGYVV